MTATIAIDTPAPAARFRPPVPAPRRTAMGLFAFLKAARQNPITTWMEAHFTAPVVAGDGAMGRITVVSDPALIRYLLVENVANYRKDDLQRRVLAPGLGNGLLSAEGDAWKLQRRTLAPIFSARTVQGFSEAMNASGAKLARRLARRDGTRVDVALEMTRVTLDVLERTIFTQGLPGDPDALGRAITRFLEAVGPIDPLDVFGVPDFVPRLGRLRARPAGRYFAEVVEDLIARRKALVAAGGAPQDLLTLLLAAQDPETGKGLTDLEVQANIITFIAAGHETTANALTWALYCLSQDDAARERLEAEVDAAGEGDVAVERAALRQGGDGGGDAAVPAGAVPQPPGDPRRPPRPHQDSARLDGAGGALRAAPAPHPVGRSGRLRARAVPGREPRRDPALRLPAVRGGPAGLHRPEFFAAGGGDRAGARRPGRAVPDAGRPSADDAAAPGDAAARARPAHGCAPPLTARPSAARPRPSARAGG